MLVKVEAHQDFHKFPRFDTILITFTRYCAVFDVPKGRFPRCVWWSFCCVFKWWKYVFYGYTNGNYVPSCVLRIDNSKTWKPVNSANKIFLWKVGLSMHSYVFGECIDNPPLSINPLVSEYSGSKVDPILIKYQPKNKFLKGSFQKIGFEWLKLCEWLKSSENLVKFHIEK